MPEGMTTLSGVKSDRHIIVPRGEELKRVSWKRIFNLTYMHAVKRKKRGVLITIRSSSGLPMPDVDFLDFCNEFARLHDLHMTRFIVAKHAMEVRYLRRVGPGVEQVLPNEILE